MTIKEIEQATGLPRASVRFYESEGFLSPTRGENGYRSYSQTDLDTLLKIKLLRRLDIPLEDIKALQKDQCSLDSVLSTALTRLEQDSTRLEQALEMCRTLRREQNSYSALNPRPYLQRLDTPASTSAEPAPQPVYDRLPEAHCPFRRFFARNLDFFLYNVLFMLFCQLVLRVNILSGHPALKFCTDFLAPLGLTLLLEPLMLHFFCTTPGKFLFGLKITRGDGSPLGLGEAFTRTMGVLVRGMGLNIPVITTITQGYSLYQIYKGRPLGWDYDLDEVAYWDGNRPGRSYWDSGRSFLKIILAGVLAVVCVITLANGQSNAMAPKHQGDMTVEQFVENFNDFRKFIAAEGTEPSTQLTTEGTFEEISQPGNVIVIDPYDAAPSQQFDFRADQSGILKEVSFSYIVQGNTVAPVPLERTAAAVFSFLYGQPGIDQDELAQVHDEIIRLAADSPKSGSLSYHHSFTGAEVDFQMTFQDFFFTPLGTLIPESEGQPSCEMSFSVCLDH